MEARYLSFLSDITTILNIPPPFSLSLSFNYKVYKQDHDLIVESRFSVLSNLRCGL